VSGSHVECRSKTVAVLILSGAKASFEKSVQTPAVIALFFRINRLLCSGIVAEPSDSSFFLKVAGVISLRKINIFCKISMRRNEVG